MPPGEVRPSNWNQMLEEIEKTLDQATDSLAAHEKQLAKLEKLALPEWQAWRERIDQWTEQLGTLQELVDKASVQTRATDEVMQENEAALRKWLQTAEANRRELARLS